jgi:hypothetical protein
VKVLGWHAWRRDRGELRLQLTPAPPAAGCRELGAREPCYAFGAGALGELERTRKRLARLARAAAAAQVSAVDDQRLRAGDRHRQLGEQIPQAGEAHARGVICEKRDD